MNTQVNQAVVTDAELIDFSRDVFEYYSIRERVTDADQSDIDRIYKAHYFDHDDNEEEQYSNFYDRCHLSNAKAFFKYYSEDKFDDIDYKEAYEHWFVDTKHTIHDVQKALAFEAKRELFDVNYHELREKYSDLFDRMKQLSQAN